MGHISSQQPLHQQSLPTQRQQQQTARALPPHVGHVPPMELGINSQHPGLQNNDRSSNRFGKHPQHPLQFPQHQQQHDSLLPVNNVRIPTAIDLDLNSHAQSQGESSNSTDTSLNLQQQLNPKAHLNMLHHHQNQQVPAHLTYAAQMKQQQNIVDWNQVHGDLCKPQNYGVNSMASGYQHSPMNRTVPLNCSPVRQAGMTVPPSVGLNSTSSNSCDSNQSLNAPFPTPTFQVNHSNSSSPYLSSPTQVQDMKHNKIPVKNDVHLSPQPKTNTVHPPVQHHQQVHPQPPAVPVPPQTQNIITTPSVGIPNSVNPKMQMPRINLQEAKVVVNKIHPTVPPKAAEAKLETCKFIFSYQSDPNVLKFQVKDYNHKRKNMQLFGINCTA